MELSELLTELKSYQSGLDKKIAELTEKTNNTRLLCDQTQAQLLRPDAGGGARRTQTKGLGEAVTESDEFKSFIAHGAKGRVIFVAPRNPLWESKITLSDFGTPTATGVPVQQIGIVSGQTRQLRVRDLLPASPAEAGVIEFTRETGYANLASPAAEASDKNESTISFTPAQEVVKTIAHWTRLSRQAAADIPGLTQYVNGRLSYGLDLKVEAQILAGSGVGEALNGLITQSADYDTGLNVSGDTMIDKLRHAIYQCESSERGPCDGIVLHPKDWEKIELIKDEAVAANKGRYMLGSPGGSGVTIKTLWQRPIVESFSMDQGTFLVGGFATGAHIRNRMETVIDISESHGEFFVKNLLAVRAECRLALICTVPELFVNGSF